MAHLLSFIDTRPQFEIPTSPNPAPPLPLRNINTASKKALVVAHESLILLLRRCLEEDGYAVRSASGTEEGMRMFCDLAPFNAVIIDYDAPQRNGDRVDYSLPQTRAKELASDILKINPSQAIILAASAYRKLDELSFPHELMHIPVLVGDISIFQLRTLLSTLEVRRALATLTVADKLRLKHSAEYRIRGVGRAAHNRTAEDLIAEAQLRTLVGARHWNRNIDFVRHLEGVIQSVACCWKKHGDKDTYLMTEVLSFSAEGQDISPLERLHTPDPAADRDLIAKEEVASLFRIFASDTEATQVLQGLYDDLKPNEIRQKYGLDEKRFASAKKRIRVETMSRRNGGGEEHGI